MIISSGFRDNGWASEPPAVVDADDSVFAVHSKFDAGRRGSQAAVAILPSKAVVEGSVLSQPTGGKAKAAADHHGDTQLTFLNSIIDMPVGNASSAVFINCVAHARPELSVALAVMNHSSALAVVSTPSMRNPVTELLIE